MPICPVKFDSTTKRKKAWLGQPHLFVNLENQVGRDVKCMRETKTP